MQRTVPNLVEHTLICSECMPVVHVDYKQVFVSSGQSLIRSECMPAVLVDYKHVLVSSRQSLWYGVWGTKSPQPKDLTKLYFVLVMPA